MKIITKFISPFVTLFIAPCLLIICILSITACGNNKESAKAEDHFMNEKLDTIKKAEAVDQLVQDAAATQRRTIDEQSE